MKKGGVVVENGFTYEEETHLTVLKTSLFFAGDGFTVYDCKGELVFRVDSYGQDAHDHAELVLMDAYGHCLLTIRQKRPSLHQRWEGFRGERKHGEKPIFSVRRSSMIGRSTVTVEVYGYPGRSTGSKGRSGSGVACSTTRRTNRWLRSDAKWMLRSMWCLARTSSLSLSSLALTVPSPWA
ncbi:LURP-one-like protein [Actinidia rufa]|uniref:LURP-one-like protein n=1 Tax=Actinidia rufa TaxID=165716 RepID=A0A7J0FEU4_9ERIC|nr:LURP-one-like protein [Actinidia rufa]